ncbi:MAG: hypothetical protein QOD82_4940 [Pseudonocardiales bacterium]|nr:hypothetical protein [Pseudonocardiales bacterium]
MTSPSSAGQRLTREAPRVGDYRRGARLRTTTAGTWFPAVGPDQQPAGLLLVHPGVDLRILVPTIERLAELNLPGVLTPNPALLEQAGRNWLVTRAAAVPTLADVLEDGAHREPGNAAALLSDVAATLLTTHRAGLPHGALDARSILIGQDGAALLTDWGTNKNATAAGDVSSWALLAELLAQRWCGDDLVSAAALARAVHAANGPTGLAGGFDQLRGLAHAARRDTLAQAAKDELDAVGRGEVRPPRRPQSRRAQPAPPAPTEPPVAAAAAVPQVPAEAAVAPPVEPVEPAVAAPVEAVEPAVAEPVEPHHDTHADFGAPPSAGHRTRPAPDADAPWAIPAAAREPDPKARGAKRDQVPRWRLVLLVSLVVITLVAAAADLVLLVTRNTEASALKIQSVVLWAQRSGTGCSLLGVITTNGEAGTVTYGWTGDTATGPAISTQVQGGHTQIEVSRQWNPDTASTLDPLVTLQVLRPALRQASVQPELDCSN